MGKRTTNSEYPNLTLSWSVTMLEKKCGKCKKVKPLEEFYFNKSLNKPTNRCKTCIKEESKNTYSKNHTIPDCKKSPNGFKRCSKCYNIKPLSLFSKSRSEKIGVTSQCKSCFKEYRQKNKERLAIQEKKCYEKNKVKINHRNREYDRKRMSADPAYRLMKNLKRRVSLAVTDQGTAKHTNTMTLVGCSLKEIRQHIEKQFTNGMSWDNYGFYGWHLDHINPCASFDLTDPKQQKTCFHYSNLQPLWAEDNLKKSKKVKNKKSN